MSQFASPAEIRRDVAEIIRPPRRISVSQCAIENVRVNTPGGYSGPWDIKQTPYMLEPMNMLKSRKHGVVVMVAPARAGKTMALLDCWLAHGVIADPGDIGLYFSTQALAQDYRKRRVERLHRHSPKIRERLSSRLHDTTVGMVVYRTGMILNLGWPTSSQLAQRDLRYVAMTDFDSFPDDIDGEGNPFDLARKRIQVAMSGGMCLVESSPKRPMTVADWTPRTKHEAPPTAGGVLPLYNRGDRRRWFWECFAGCKKLFEAPALPTFTDDDDVHAAAKTACVPCPECGTIYRQKDKVRLNNTGVWIADSESNIASFWLLGCAAAFQNWDSIVANYLVAKRYCEESGDESSLAATTNTDQGLPYRPEALNARRGARYLSDRAKDETEKFHVPAGVRALFGTVDIQGNRFEVAVWGHGHMNERWLVDRYALTKTKDGDRLNPSDMIEHWEIITERVVEGTYKLGDGRKMRLHAVGVDSGGEDGVTERAYAWWRGLAKAGIARNVHLVRGGAAKTAPMTKLSAPGGRGKGRAGGRPTTVGIARGDVPVLRLNSNLLKDAIHIDLAREVPGPGYINFPNWTPKKIFEELASEERTERGWFPISRRRNETWDLLAYDRALWHHLGGDSINWDRPPSWMNEWVDNPNVLKEWQGPGAKKLTAADFKVF